MDMGERENGRVNRDSLITVEDLKIFKEELLSEFKQILRSAGVQPVKKWMKTDEVRNLLDVSIGTLQTMRINGILPYTKIGGVLYYDYEDIMDMLDSKKAKANSR
jgi:hypothetical protein